MNKSFKIFLAFIAAITISAGLIISYGPKESGETVKTGLLETLAENMGPLDDGMKKAMLIAKDELQDVDYTAKNSSKN